VGIGACSGTETARLGPNFIIGLVLKHGGIVNSLNQIHFPFPKDMFDNQTVTISAGLAAGGAREGRRGSSDCTRERLIKQSPLAAGARFRNAIIIGADGARNACHEASHAPLPSRLHCDARHTRRAPVCANVRCALADVPATKLALLWR
jgi:hypothetical protein